MADTRKVLGQSNPAARTLTDLYTVPGAASVVVSSIVICNQSTADAKARVSVAVAGAADEPKQYLYYDLDVPGNETFIATIGITLAATDVVRVYSDTDYLSFNLFGLEST